MRCLSIFGHACTAMDSHWLLLMPVSTDGPTSLEAGKPVQCQQQQRSHSHGVVMQSLAGVACICGGLTVYARGQHALVHPAWTGMAPLTAHCVLSRTHPSRQSSAHSLNLCHCPGQLVHALVQRSSTFFVLSPTCACARSAVHSTFFVLSLSRVIVLACVCLQHERTCGLAIRRKDMYM